MARSFTYKVGELSSFVVRLAVVYRSSFSLLSREADACTRPYYKRSRDNEDLDVAGRGEDRIIHEILTAQLAGWKK